MLNYSVAELRINKNLGDNITSNPQLRAYMIQKRK